jgi:hypothetical protein
VSLTDEQTFEVLAKHLAARPRPIGKHASPYLIELARVALQSGAKKSEVARRFNLSKTTVSRIAKRQADDVEQALSVLIDLVDAEAEIAERIPEPTSSDLIFLCRVGALLSSGFSMAAAKSAVARIEALSVESR